MSSSFCSTNISLCLLVFFYQHFFKCLLVFFYQHFSKCLLVFFYQHLFMFFLVFKLVQTLNVSRFLVHTHNFVHFVFLSVLDSHQINTIFFVILFHPSTLFNIVKFSCCPVIHLRHNNNLCLVASYVLVSFSFLKYIRISPQNWASETYVFGTSQTVSRFWWGPTNSVSAGWQGV